VVDGVDTSIMRNVCAIYYFGYEGSGTLIGLKTDGTVVVTGKNERALQEVQTWENIAALSFWNNIAIGVKYDGTVITTSNVGDTSGWRLFD